MTKVNLRSDKDPAPVGAGSNMSTGTTHMALRPASLIKKVRRAEDKPKKEIGKPWSEEEMQKLQSIISRVGITSANWADIARAGPSWLGNGVAVVSARCTQHTTAMQELPGRTGKQCREKWKNDLRPNISKEPWSAQEEYILALAHSRVGNKWADIAKYLPRRAENTIKNHWYATNRAKADDKVKTFLWVYGDIIDHTSQVPPPGSFEKTVERYLTLPDAVPLEIFRVPEDYFIKLARAPAGTPAAAFPFIRPYPSPPPPVARLSSFTSQGSPRAGATSSGGTPRSRIEVPGAGTPQSKPQSRLARPPIVPDNLQRSLSFPISNLQQLDHALGRNHVMDHPLGRTHSMHDLGDALGHMHALDHALARARALHHLDGALGRTQSLPSAHEMSLQPNMYLRHSSRPESPHAWHPRNPQPFMHGPEPALSRLSHLAPQRHSMSRASESSMMMHAQGPSVSLPISEQALLQVSAEDAQQHSGSNLRPASKCRSPSATGSDAVQCVVQMPLQGHGQKLTLKRQASESDEMSHGAGNNPDASWPNVSADGAVLLVKGESHQPPTKVMRPSTASGTSSQPRLSQEIYDQLWSGAMVGGSMRGPPPLHINEDEVDNLWEGILSPQDYDRLMQAVKQEGHPATEQVSKESDNTKQEPDEYSHESEAAPIPYRPASQLPSLAYPAAHAYKQMPRLSMANCPLDLDLMDDGFEYDDEMGAGFAPLPGLHAGFGQRGYTRQMYPGQGYDDGLAPMPRPFRMMGVPPTAYVPQVSRQSPVYLQDPEDWYMDHPQGPPPKLPYVRTRMSQSSFPTDLPAMQPSHHLAQPPLNYPGKPMQLRYPNGMPPTQSLPQWARGMLPPRGPMPSMEGEHFRLSHGQGGQIELPLMSRRARSDVTDAGADVSHNDAVEQLQGPAAATATDVQAVAA